MPPSMPVSHTGNKDAVYPSLTKGTHVSIEPFHLNRYIYSEAFRFNNRDGKDADRFAMAMQGLSGKRLTYKALIGMDAMGSISRLDN
jgi:hypothetical protein